MPGTDTSLHTPGTATPPLASPAGVTASPHPAPQPSPQPSPRRRSLRRRLFWAGFAVLLLLLLALTPPLVNVNRFRHRIAQAMSASLGRPVHLDNVSLHLLPVPGFTLTNLVVSEEPGFGDEPTIRANEVDVSLRASSLWRRRVEFSTVRFVEPSLNLVRDAAGRWNLEDLLVHASRVDTAPTSQHRAGPAPRFPYIEATGARVNVKLGDNKLPFSLTDADFALWLPSASEWKLRLTGTPTRTDANIGDPGTVRLEGTLHRAAHMAEVPVDMHASWHDVPLGEWSRLLTGDDAGWRGMGHADAWLTGKLGAGELRTQVTLDSLRRADFVPSQPLDLSLGCTAGADSTSGTLTGLVCGVPTGGALPLTLRSAELSLQNPAAAVATLQARQVPLEWAFGILRLVSTRLPPGPPVAGTWSASLTHAADRTWHGDLSAEVPPFHLAPDGAPLPTAPRNSADDSPPATQTTQTWTATIAPRSAPAPPAAPGRGAASWQLTVPQTAVPLGAHAALQVSGTADVTGVQWQLSGEASLAQLQAATRSMPQLLEGLTGQLQTGNRPADTLLPLAFACARGWAAVQSCTPLAGAAPAAPRSGRHRR